MLAASLRSYHLEKLLSPFHFDTDPEDGIRDVIVTCIKLKPHRSKCAVELTIPLNHKKRIHEVAKDWFEQHTPFNENFYVKKAKIAIQLEAQRGEHGGQVIPLTLYYPDRCDLKDHPEKEPLIAKYLKKWGLIEEEED